MEFSTMLSERWKMTWLFKNQDWLANLLEGTETDVDAYLLPDLIQVDYNFKYKTWKHYVPKQYRWVFV